MKQGGQVVTCPICNEPVRTFKGTYGVALVVHPPKKSKVGDIECEGTGTLVEPSVKK